MRNGVSLNKAFPAHSQVDLPMWIKKFLFRKVFRASPAVSLDTGLFGNSPAIVLIKPMGHSQRLQSPSEKVIFSTSAAALISL